MLSDWCIFCLCSRIDFCVTCEHIQEQLWQLFKWAGRRRWCAILLCLFLTGRKVTFGWPPDPNVWNSKLWTDAITNLVKWCAFIFSYCKVSLSLLLFLFQPAFSSKKFWNQTGLWLHFAGMGSCSLWFCRQRGELGEVSEWDSANNSV